jgi:hypothetical protein
VAIELPEETFPGVSSRRFYRWAAVALALIVFVGFARSFYLRAEFGKQALPLPLQLHGLVLTSWFVLFFVQTYLVAAHRVDLHRRLGVFGAGLAAVVLAVGSITLVVAAAHHSVLGSDLFFQLLIGFDGLHILVFAGLVAYAVVLRRQPEFHKRLMLLATISLLPPAIGRITLIFTRRGSFFAVLVAMVACVLVVIVADTSRHRRLHPAFLWGGSTVLASTVVTHLFH